MSSKCVFVLFCLLNVFGVDSETNRSGQESGCSVKKVLVRDVYLALKSVSGSCETMALLLDIPEGKWGNIQMDCSNNDCRYREMLKAWYNGHRSEPSWDELVFVLEQMGEYQLARGIQSEYLCFREGSRSKQTTIEGVQYSPWELMNQLEIEFEDLTFAALKYFQNGLLDLDKFKHHLTQLPVSLKNPNKVYFSREFIQDIMKAESILVIFGYLNMHVWNFLQYDIFQHIVLKFGNEELLSQLRKYLSRVSEFRKATTLSQFFKLWPNGDTPPSGYTEYVVKLKGNSDELTLEDVEKVRLESAIRYTLPAYAFRLAAVEKGCVLMKWFLRSVVVREIVHTEARTNSLLSIERSLLYQKVGDYVMLDVKQQLCTLALLKVNSNAREILHQVPTLNKSKAYNTEVVMILVSLVLGSVLLIVSILLIVTCIILYSNKKVSKDVNCKNSKGWHMTQFSHRDIHAHT